MKTIILPEPARQLWIQTRDILTNLGSPEHPWRIHLGGGTILAARLKHRQSTDIDIVVRNTKYLTTLIQKDENNLATRLGGRSLRRNDTQIKVKLEHGIIDLSAAQVRPKNGAHRVKIDNRPQHVLSTTQILRGKLERAAEPAPVRDVYDVIRVAHDDEFADQLVAAYSMLSQYQKDAIETMWNRLDGEYERQAKKYLRLTEKPCADLRHLGSTAAKALNEHRLTRLVIELNHDKVSTKRTTLNGRTFTERSNPNTITELYRKNGVDEVLDVHGLTTHEIAQRIAISRAEGLNAVILDTTQPNTRHRFAVETTSTKRSREPTRSGNTEFLPPSPELLSGARIDHSDEISPVRPKKAEPGEPQTTRTLTKKTPSTPGTRHPSSPENRKTRPRGRS